MLLPIHHLLDVIASLDKVTAPLLEKLGEDPDYFAGGRIH